jgi:ribosomal protein L37AE/L43A
MQDAGETVDKKVSCPRCGEENPRGAGVCSRCGETLKAASPQGAEWEGELHLPLALVRIAVREYDWAIKSENLEILRSLLERAEQALERKDEINGRVVLEELKQALSSICGGIDDLLYASLAFRHGMGDLDQNQRLGSMLVEFKRRVLEGEDPNSGEAGKLRGEQIPRLVQEILERLGDQDKIVCENCQNKRVRPSPLHPNCEHCGHIPLGLKA